MPRGLWQKLALYSILPCLLVLIAIFLNGLFQPEFQWKLKLLESEGESYRIENLETNKTILFDQPSLRVSSKEDWPCATHTDVVYIQNKLIQDRLTLEKWIDTNNGFTFTVLLLAILHAFGNAIYLVIKQKVNFIDVLFIVFFICIGAIMLVTVFGPLISGGQFACWAQVKVEAELTKISFDGVIYPIIGVIINILAIIIMAKQYIPKSIWSQIDEESPG